MVKDLKLKKKKKNNTKKIKSKIIKNLLDPKSITIFSKSYCPYCNLVKKELSSLNINHKVIELDQINNGDLIQNELKKITKVSTVPSVWINNTYIGGSEKTIQYINKKYK